MEYQQECQNISLSSGSVYDVSDLMKENLRLRKELAEKEKQILFLKKVAAFFVKEKYYPLFGVRWLLKHI